ncbi:hypothetical protein SAMN05443252_106267 [Bacillus sp. OV322]|nr:hypothetical protein SAMN05443252_106267 [Bacillus sp. OV322]
MARLRDMQRTCIYVRKSQNYNGIVILMVYRKNIESVKITMFSSKW